MVEAAISLRRETLAPPAVADDDGAKKNGAGIDGSENAKVATGDFYLGNDGIMDFGGTRNGGVISEGFNGNIVPCSGDGEVVIEAQAVEKIESSNGEFSGKEAENVVGEGYMSDFDLEHDRIVDMTENGNGFGGTENGGETDEGFNGNIIRDQAGENLFDSFGEFWGKEAENVVGKDNKLDDDDYANVTGVDSQLEDDKIMDKDVDGVTKARETSDGFNNIIRRGGDERVVIGAQAAEKLFESDGMFLDKDVENVVKEDHRCPDDDNRFVMETQRFEENFWSSDGNRESDFSEDGLDKNVDNKGISLVVEISVDNNVGKCDGVDIEKAGREGESKDGENVPYSVGDFVWGRFNSHLWWPGQIYDPSDASDHAKDCSNRGKQLLVAYFVDDYFSWRSPSQLKPFSENFNELSKQSDSIIFLTAVQSALNEIGRVAELKMTCPCISEAKKAGLNRPAMVNAGIKEGVIGPECDFSRFPVSDFEPTRLLSQLRNIAEANPVESMLELTGLRSCLSAFCRSNRGRKLALFHEGVEMEGLENQTRNGSDRSVMQKCDGLFEDKLKTKRKRKSVAKLMRESVISEPNTNKKMKSINKSHISSVKKVSSSEHGGDEGHEKALNDNAGSVLEGETGDMTASSRKRKKSKYLSYPYTDLGQSVVSFGPNEDWEAESVKISKIARVGEKMNRAAARLTQSSPILKKKLSRKFENFDIVGDTSALSGSKPQEEYQKKMMEPVNIEASSEEVITLVRSAAINPKTFWCSHARDMVNDFMSAYRNVVYKGSEYEPPNKKRKSLSSTPGLVVERKEKHDEKMTLINMKREMRENNNKAKKSITEGTDNDGLLFIKQKLEKMTLMVENCDVDMFPDMRFSLQTEMRELLEKISAMVNTASS